METDLVVEVHRVLLCGLLVPVARRPSLDQVLTGTPSVNNTTLLMGLTNSKRLLKYSWGKLFSSVYSLHLDKQMFEIKIQILSAYFAFNI